MSQLIYDLARRAGATDAKGGRADGVFCLTRDELKTFAESIVRECSEVITDLPNRMATWKLSPYNEGWRNGRLLAKDHIEHHFGLSDEAL